MEFAISGRTRRCARKLLLVILILSTTVPHSISAQDEEESSTEVQYSVSSSTSIDVGAVGRSADTGGGSAGNGGGSIIEDVNNGGLNIPHDPQDVVASSTTTKTAQLRRAPPGVEKKQNLTREALSHDASEHESVVFIGEGNNGYVPVPPLRPRQDEEEDEDWRLTTAVDTWDREYRRFRFNTTRVQHIEAECQDDYMKIRVGFNGSFTGLVYSAGYAYDPDCMYINGTGRDYYEFYIQLNRCGTLGKNTHNEDNRKSPTKNFMWNTVTVQYNPLIEEEYDEHFKVTCEYGYDFWKTVTFPFLDVEVATGNPVVFTLTPPECYMEIRYGYGTQGNRVTGPVRVGDPLTLIIYMRSKYDGFDIVVNDCYAHNGATKKIQLIDEYGCPVDDKLISRFRGSWSDSGVYETQIFAYMKTFRFTGSPALYIECDVRMCHGRCPSQPCHWRNIKNTRKRRAIDGQTSAATATTTQSSSSLSENVNLFQSLRVLQEGEDDAERNSTTNAYRDPNSVCIKTGWFSALLALGGVAMCLLGGALLATCTRLKRSAIDKVLSSGHFDGYMNHKGSIN